MRDAQHDAFETCLAGDRQAQQQPLHEAREPQHRQQPADQRERERHRDRRDHRPVLAEDLDAERQRHQERQEDAEDAHHLLDRGGGGHFDGLAAEARGVVELVAVEPGGARQEGADEAPDQERTEDVTERELDALAAQQHQPAVHRREDADELDARRERRRRARKVPSSISATCARISRQAATWVASFGHLAGEVQRLDLRRIHLHLVIEQQPEGAHRHPGLEQVQDPPAPGRRREARNCDREQRDDQDLEKNRHPGTRSVRESGSQIREREDWEREDPSASGVVSREGR